MKEQICQSCSRPMSEVDFGSNADKTKNTDYCNKCFENGQFTYGYTMDEMIEACIPPMLEVYSNMSAAEAKGQMKELFPSLLRWK
ncbi:putative zinc ribbon protein [Kineothrix alysoides]|uniref:Putative zinc ribbon protein n=1 Tax=Kineothrix alysoides TaxID=1469948 RepID=A0A4R1QNZ1_9FIRM|nr:zinc ribbon domain-containing protein [Kineothrix alysoides]TCL54591.1 putative zinc ribbon protein [Kineothrix alysoides]